MTIDQLQALVLAAREGSITRASDLLHVQQSSLSRRIRTLETELGCELFERRGPGIALTEKGRHFLPFAQDIVLRAEEARRLVGSKPAVFASTLVVGATPSLATYVLPDLLQRFTRNTPGAPRITVRTGVTPLRRLLEEGRVDLVLSRSRWDSSTLTSYPLFEEPLLLVCRPGHPLAALGRPLVASELGRADFICSEFSSQYWQAIEAFLAGFGLSLSVAMDVDHCDTVKELLTDSDYLAFLAKSAVWGDVESGRLAALTLAGHAFPPCPAYVTFSPAGKNPERDRFLAFIGVPNGMGPDPKDPGRLGNLDTSQGRWYRQT